MTEAEGERITDQNPALELYDLILPWAVTPQGTSVYEYRKKLAQGDYWPVHSEANGLLDLVSEYLRERGDVNRRPSAGATEIALLRAGLNNPGQAGLSTVNGNSNWQTIDERSLDWLMSVGQGWNRGHLVRHVAELEEINSVAGALMSHLEKLPDLDPMHRDYLLTLTEALQKAVRRSYVDGEPPTARLALELASALEAFAPKSEKNPEGDSWSVRLRKAAGSLLISYGPMAIEHLGPLVMGQITQG